MTRQILLVYRCRQCTSVFTGLANPEIHYVPIDVLQPEPQQPFVFDALTEALWEGAGKIERREVAHQCGPVTAGIAELIGAQVETTEP